MHPKLAIVESTIHGILSPLGFKKQKLVWRRAVPDMLQMVGLDKKTYGYPDYNFHYGLFLSRYSEDPRPPVHEAHVQWSIAEKLPTVDDRSRLFPALRMNHDMPDESRVAAVRELIQAYVLPAFAATDTIDKLREVLKDYKNPFCTWLTSFETI